MELQPKFSMSQIQTKPSDFWQFAAVCNWLSVFGPWVGLDVDVLKLEPALLEPLANYELLADIHMALLKSMQKKPEVVTQLNWQQRLQKYVKDNWGDMWSVQELPLLQTDKQLIMDTDYVELHYEYRLGILHDLCVGVMKYAGPFSDSITAIVRAGRSYELRLPVLGEYKDLREETPDTKCQYWLPCVDAPLLFTDYEGDWTPVSLTEEELANFVSRLESDISSERTKRKKLTGKGKAKAKAKAKKENQSAISAALLQAGDDLLANLKVTVETCSEARIQREEKEQAEIKKRERDSRRIAMLQTQAANYTVEAGSRRTRTRVNYALDQDDDYLDDILENQQTVVSRSARGAPRNRTSRLNSSSSSEGYQEESDSDAQREQKRKQDEEQKRAQDSERERTSRRGRSRSTHEEVDSRVPDHEKEQNSDSDSSAEASVPVSKQPSEAGSDDEEYGGAKLKQVDTSASMDWQPDEEEEKKSAALHPTDTGGSVGWVPSEHEDEIDSDESNSKYASKSSRRKHRSTEKSKRKRKRKREQEDTYTEVDDGDGTRDSKPKHHRKLVRLCDVENDADGEVEEKKDESISNKPVDKAEKLDPEYKVRDGEESYSPSSESSETLLDIELMRDAADERWVDGGSDHESDASYDFAEDLQRERSGAGSDDDVPRHKSKKSKSSKKKRSKDKSTRKPARENTRKTARKSYEEWHSEDSGSEYEGGAGAGSDSDYSGSDEDYK